MAYDEAAGVVTFPREPASVTYDYQTGYNDILMDVTLSGETKGDGPTSNRGGGGCDTLSGGLVLLALLVLSGLAARREK